MTIQMKATERFFPVVLYVILQVISDNSMNFLPTFLSFVRGEPEVSSTEVTASEQPQPTPSTAVVSGKRQRDEPQVTDRSDGFTCFFKKGAS